MIARLSSIILLLTAVVTVAAAPSDSRLKISHSTHGRLKNNEHRWKTLQKTSATATLDEIKASDSASDSHSMPSPESLKLKPRIISLNIMVAGLAGLGKTTLCRALLDAWWDEIQEDKETSAGKTKGFDMARLGSLASSFTSSLSAGGSSTSSGVSQTRARRTISTTAISPSAPFEYFDEKANTILRVRIIDTPGFGNRVNHRNSVKPITDYISDCRRKRFRREKSPSFKQSSGDDDDANNRMLVHVCLYFLSPGRFLAIDRHFLKHVQDEVTIVPVIAKADTMTDEEIARYRAELARIWEDESIGVYSLDERHDRKFKFGGRTNVTRPNVANSGNEKFYRGRRPGEALAIICRDGMYPWGHSYALDPEHSDLKLIRDSLLSEHTERFLELATAKYVAFRDAQIAKQSRSETLKYVALIGLAAMQLGRMEIQGTQLREVVAKSMAGFAPFFEKLRLPKLQLSLAGLKSLTGKEPEPEEEEVPEPPKKIFPFGLFGKLPSDSKENEPETVEPEPETKKKRFGLF